MQNGNKSLAASAMFLLGTVILTQGLSPVGAVTSTTTSRAVEMNRIRVNYNDFNGSANMADPGGVCNGLAKRVVIDNVAAGGQINTIVTNVRTAFASSAATQIGLVALVAEQGGVQVSTGDIAVPHTDLMSTGEIENSNPNAVEIAFYDENAAWQAVAYICGRDGSAEPVDISGLTAGSVDFYVTQTR